MSWLYRYETKGIQSWILDSNLLRDLAGGSALVEQLSKEARKRAEREGGRVKQATSGAMTAEFPSRESLNSFASVWPLEVSLRAPGLQLVQAWVEQQHGIEALFRRLAEARNSPHVDDIEAGPWVLRAGKSGLPAVSAHGIQSKARATAFDSRALARERAYRDLKEEPGVVTGGLPWGAFNVEIDEWAERDKPVAVVHADGSGVGQKLLGLDSDQLQIFSESLLKATTAATRRAIETLPEYRGIDARPIVSAGDDLTYLVPASCARRFALTWLRAIEEETETLKMHLGGAKITGGAGIVIVHRKHPFSQAYEMAESLCSAAKSKLKKLGMASTSVLSVRRITSSWIRSIEDTALAWRVAGSDDPLGELAEAVRSLPRGTLRNWLTYFDQDDARAIQLWRRAKEVARPEAWDLFETALVKAGGDPETGALKEGAVAISLDTRPKVRATPVRDAIALRYFEEG